MSIPGLPWEVVDNRNLPSMRIQYEYLKMSYGYNRVGLRVAKNVVREFVVDRRSTTVLDGSIKTDDYDYHDYRQMTIFHQDWNSD